MRSQVDGFCDHWLQFDCGVVLHERGRYPPNRKKQEAASSTIWSLILSTYLPIFRIRYFSPRTAELSQASVRARCEGVVDADFQGVEPILTRLTGIFFTNPAPFQMQLRELVSHFWAFFAHRPWMEDGIWSPSRAPSVLASSHAVVAPGWRLKRELLTFLKPLEERVGTETSHWSRRDAHTVRSNAYQFLLGDAL